MKRSYETVDLCKDSDDEIVEGGVRWCPDGVNPDVWASLPEEIRDDLSREYADCVREKASVKTELSDSRLLVPSMFQRSRLQNMVWFTDNDFPPSASSIDGRLSSPEIESFVPKKCNCQKPARVRQVHKAGPNLGRLFYGCWNGASKTTDGKSCNFFSWADDAPHSTRAKQIIWRRCIPNNGWCFHLPARGFKAEDVLQGGVGNCWFLSAVAVLTEREDLMEKVIRSRSFSPDGSATFRLFIDGHFCDVTVDNFLPFKQEDKKKAPLKPDLYFSKAKLSQLWMPLLEKAYAKAHGSYEAISGGFICEALLDLTGAPCETISFFSEDFDSDESWNRLLSFHLAHFPMGCSTDSSGEGIVGNHAYSILDVREISNERLGSQPTIKSFFGTEPIESHGVSNSPIESADAHFELALPVGSKEPLSNKWCGIETGEAVHASKPTLRLVRIRNPWGKTEWSGEMSRSSDLWTSKLLRELEVGTKNDGTFWMFYHDFLRRFTSVEVCKCFDDKANWSTSIEQCRTSPKTLTCGSSYEFVISTFTWLFLFTVQKTKRGRSRTQQHRGYWYSDISIVVCDIDGAIVGASFNGHRRDGVPIELQLEAGKYYIYLLHFQPHVSLSSTRESLEDVFSLILYRSRNGVTVQPRELSINLLDATVASIVKCCLLNCLRFSAPVAYKSTCGFRGRSYLRYIKRHAVVTFSTPPIENLSGTFVDRDLDPPVAHVLHGVGGIMFVVIINSNCADLSVHFEVTFSSECRIQSPYVTSAEELKDTAGGIVSESKRCLSLKISGVSAIVSAVVFDTVYAVELGRNLALKFSNCFFGSVSFPDDSQTAVHDVFTAFSLFNSRESFLPQCGK